MWLNFADLIHNSVPDREGNTLPADLTSGTYDLEDLNPGLGGNLIEGKLMVDKTWGHLTYGCLQCCGWTPYLSPTPVNVVVNGVQDIEGLGLNNCTGQGGYNLGSYLRSTGTWWSDNGGIAAVTAFQAQGVAPGTTNGYARANIPSGDGGRPKPPCPDPPQEASAPVPVFKFVVSGNPFIFVGTNTNVVSANSFFASDGAGGSPKPTGGTVSATSSDSSDTFQISQGSLPTAKVATSDQSASDLDRTLTFTYTVSGTGAISQPMKVTARQFAYLTNDNPSNQCTLGYGTDKTYTYTIYTHPDKTAVDASSGLSGTPTNENFNPSLQCDVIGGSGSLNTNGQFTDHISSVCSGSPLTCSQTTTQSISITNYPVRTNTLIWTSTGVTYTNDGPTQ